MTHARAGYAILGATVLMVGCASSHRNSDSSAITRYEDVVRFLEGKTWHTRGFRVDGGVYTNRAPSEVTASAQARRMLVEDDGPLPHLSFQLFQQGRNPTEIIQLVLLPAPMSHAREPYTSVAYGVITNGMVQWRWLEDVRKPAGEGYSWEWIFGPNRVLHKSGYGTNLHSTVEWYTE